MKLFQTELPKVRTQQGLVCISASVKLCGVAVTPRWAQKKVVGCRAPARWICGGMTSCAMAASGVGLARARAGWRGEGPRARAGSTVKSEFRDL